jgi:CheY-like chemotaxis protein
MPHKLLLADDSVTIQRVIELTFADEDVQVIAVGDGRQAIDRVVAERPDIVLADVGMPGADGYAVSTFVKDTPDLAHIPVLLLTGAFEPVDEARAARSRCDGVLAKPFEPQQLIARVKSLLGGRPPAAQAGAAVEPAAPIAVPFGPPPEVADELRAAPPSDSSRNTPAEDLDLLAPAPPRDRSSLDDYFDRLDAAFANLSGNPVAAEPTVEPDASPGPLRLDDDVPWGGVARGEAASVVLDGAPEGSPKTGGGQAPVLTGPQLFSALLEAEQGHEPWADTPVLAADSTGAPSEVWVNRIAETVAERLAEAEVRAVVVQTVREVAERLVREEIERIKARVEASR